MCMNACMHACNGMHECIRMHFCQYSVLLKWITKRYQTTFPIENDTPQGESVSKCFVMHMHALACMHAFECIVVNVLFF